MARRTFDFQESAKRLNLIRISQEMTTLPFTKEDILNWIEVCGLPKNQYFYSTLKRYNFFIEVERGKFRFKPNTPISYKVLVQVHERSSLHVKKLREPKQPEKVELTEESAIEYLKKKGYKIFKEV